MTKQLILIVFLSLGFASCTQTQRTYRIAMPMLPERIDPWQDAITNSKVIYRSAYFPMFQLTEGNLLTSAFLDLERSRAVSYRFDKFELCLKNDAKFSDGSSISPIDLEATLRSNHSARWSLPKIKRAKVQGPCVQIQLASPLPNYFHRLTHLSTTILKLSTIALPIPVGLGPYNIVSKDPNRITMEATNRPEGDFGRLEFIKINSEGTSVHDTSKIDDWNQFPAKLLSSYTLNTTRSIRRPLLRTEMLIVQHSSSRLRKSMLQCFDAQEFSKVAKLDIIPRNSLFPQGMVPAPQHDTSISNPSNTCRFEGQKPNIDFVVWRHDPALVKDYFDKHGRQLPFRVTVKKSTPERMLRRWSNNEDLLFIGVLEGSDSSPESILGELAEPGWPKKGQIPGIRQLLLEASADNNASSKLAALERAHKIALESGAIIPLGQPVKTLYFAPYITNIVLNDTSDAHPRYDLLRFSPTWAQLTGLHALLPLR